LSDISTTIRYIADASQAVGTMRALAGEAAALNKVVNATNQNIIGGQRGTNYASSLAEAKSIMVGKKGIKVFDIPSATELDPFNNTMRTLTKTVTLAKDGTVLFSAETRGARGNLNEMAAAAQNLTKAQKGLKSDVTAATSAIATQQTVLTNLRAPRARTLGRAAVNERLQQSALAAERDILAALPPPIPTTFRSSAADLATARAQRIAIANQEAIILSQEAVVRRAASRTLGATTALTNFERSNPVLQMAKANLAGLQQAEVIAKGSKKVLSNILKENLFLSQNKAAPLPAALETVR